MVQNTDEARNVKPRGKRPTRAPPAGIRAAARWRGHRAKRHSDHSTVPTTPAGSSVQIETREAMSTRRQFSTWDGIDGVFIARRPAPIWLLPAPQHPEVQAAIENAIVQILRAAGKAPDSDGQ